MNPCHDTLELIGPYVLGGLEPEEADLLVEHLRGCAACESIYRRQTRLLPLIELAGSPAVADASPDLEQRIVAGLRAEPVPAPRAPRGGRPGRRPRAAWQALVGTFAGATATIAIVAALGSVGGDEGTSAPRVQTLRLTGTSYAPDARATARFHRQEHAMRIEFVGRNLPPSRPGEHYEVWLTGPRGAFNGGTFSVGRDGWARAMLTTAPLDPRSTIDVSIDPDVRTPRSRPLIVLKAIVPA